MASAKSSSNKPESFKDFVINKGYLGFIQGDKPNEWYSLTNEQYEFIGKMANINYPFQGGKEGTPDKYTGIMSNPNTRSITYTYEVKPLDEKEPYFNMRLLLTNTDTKVARIVVFTKDLFPHNGISKTGGARIKCKTTHKKKKSV